MTVTPAVPPPMPVVTGGDLPGLAILGQWVDAAANAAQLVRPLVLSHFVPAAYKPQGGRGDAVDVAVANATGAVLLGMSLGVDPLTALQNIYVVNGRPGMYSKFKVALALRAGHAVWDEEYGPERVTVCGQRKGTEDVVRITVTIDDAKRAGWTSNAAYGKTPADMLWARAAGRVVDRIAADTLHGIASVEDLDDAQPVQPNRVRVTAADIRGTSSAELTEAPAAIDERAWAAINAEFTALGVTGKDHRLTALSRITGRHVDKGSDLTADEATLVLDTLRGMNEYTVTHLWQGDEAPADTAATDEGGDQ